jgi:hypothetical protein
MGKQSPTQNSIKLMKERGYIVAIVEKFNPHVGPHGIRQDLFGIFDLLCVGNGETVGVQCCAASGVSARLKKIADDDHAVNVAAIRKSGWKILVHGWKKTPMGPIYREVDCS